MSELQDAVAVVELLGKFFVTSARAGLWLAKSGINLAAALVAYEKAHYLEKGEVRYTTFLKNYGQDGTFLRFPAGIDAEAKKDIAKQLKNGGVPFAWAPVFKEGQEETYLCVRQQDMRKIGLLLEGYEKEQLSVGQWLDEQNEAVIKKRADEVFKTGSFEDVREICFSNAGTLSDQLNRHTELLRPHEEEYITMDLNHPENYIAVTAKTAIDPKTNAEYTKSSYMIYREGRLINTLNDERGNGRTWGQTKKRMLNELGITSDYAQLVTFREQGRDRLEQYQKLFRENENLKEKKAVDEKERPEEQKQRDLPEEIVVDKESLIAREEYDLMQKISLDKNKFIKVPIAGISEETETEIKVKVTGQIMTVYDADGIASGSMKMIEVKKKLEEIARKKREARNMFAEMSKKGRT